MRYKVKGIRIDDEARSFAGLLTCCAQLAYHIVSGFRSLTF